MDIEDEIEIENLLNNWTNKEDLAKPIYRYISIIEFATLITKNKIRCKAINTFDDPWDSENLTETIILPSENTVRFEKTKANSNQADSLDISQYYSNPEILNNVISTSTQTNNEYQIKENTTYTIANGRDYQDFHRDNYLAWCWTQTSPETMAMWLSYAKEETSVCIQSNGFDILNGLQVKPVRIGVIDYSKSELFSPLDGVFQKPISHEFENEFRFVYDKRIFKNSSQSFQYINFESKSELTLWIHPYAKSGLKEMISRLCCTADLNINVKQVSRNINHKD